MGCPCTEKAGRTKGFDWIIEMKKATTSILLAANIIIIAMMLATGFSGHLDPEKFTYLQLTGFAFPAFLAANAAFVAVWLFMDWKRVYVPAVGFLLAYSPVMTYFPINTYRDVPEDALKVLSFNVYAFNTDDVPEGEPNPILEYITQSEADIVCIQEFTNIVGQDSLWREMDRIYQYSDTLTGDSAGSVTVAMYSKYPIKAKEKLHIRSSKNAAGVFTVEMDGRQVKVINAHLETVGFSNEDKSMFSQMVHGNTDRREMKRESKTLLTKLAESSVIRSAQARIIDDYVRANSGTPLIFCGDINDHPLSYVHNTIARHLNDCYREAGHWAGYSMHYHSMYVRIDNIMCSNHWNVYDCVVDKSVTLSDHYPIYCRMKLK